MHKLFKYIAYAGANRAQLAAFMMRTCELQSELDA